jgi:hypothetical protein
MEDINWKKAVKNKHYVVVTELPDKLKDDFEKWLFGKRRPIIFKEGDNMIHCAYYSDYSNFLLSINNPEPQLKPNQQ